MSSTSARLAEMASKVPLCTFCVTALCVTIHVYTSLFQTNISGFTLAASNVIYLGEYYRIISAALLHGGIMHIVFNMMSFLGIGSGLEMSLGTLALTFLILWSIVLAGSIHVVVEWAMSMWITQDPKYVYQHALGFSGVIFTLAVMESHRSTTPTRSLFGFMQVSTKLYPWALLVLLSVLMPGISFIGHLSGILVGELHVYGYTKPLLPSPAYLVEMENWSLLREHIVRRSNFVTCPLPPSAADVDEDNISSSGLFREMGLPIYSFFQRALWRFRDRAGARGASEAADGDIEATGRGAVANV